MPSIILKNAIEFFDKLKASEFVTLEFTKKDGSLRKMKCTLNWDMIPVDKRPKNVNMISILKLMNGNKIIHVFDIEKNDWRSVPYTKVKWMIDNNKQMYNLRGL
jgi:hypothetical protein